MKSWYVHRGGQAIGPVSREQIAAAIVAGKVFDDDLFCEVGGDAWTTGGEVPELRDLWAGEDGLATAERILADSGAVPLDIDDLEPVVGTPLPALPAPGRPVFGRPVSHAPAPLSRETEPRPIGPVGPPPELPPAPVVDEQAPTELFSRDTLPPELASKVAAGRPRSPDSTARAPRTPRSDKMHRWVTIVVSVVIVGCAISLTVYALMTQTEPGVVVADPTPRGALPVPFDALSIGMSRDALEAEFPPDEALDSCRFAIVEDSLPWSLGAEAHSRCIHVEAIAGATSAERERIASIIHDRHADAEAPVLERGFIRALAQVRGASRAELVEDRQLLEAHTRTGASIQETVFSVSTELAEATLTYFSRRSQQRQLGAMMDDECTTIVAERVATYLRGELDVRRPPCRRAESRFAANVLEAGGGIVAMGAPRTTGEVTSRSMRAMRREAGLDEAHAGLVAHLADRADALETFFDGAIVLIAPEGARTTWAFAIAWLENDEVTRLLLSSSSGEHIDRLESYLGPELGNPSSSDPTHVLWDGDGWRARLDHAALALIVEKE